MGGQPGCAELHVGTLDGDIPGTNSLGRRLYNLFLVTGETLEHSHVFLK